MTEKRKRRSKKKENEDFFFPGFWHPDDPKWEGYTKLPHELIDLLPKMSDAELRVVLYIFRHTWGFQEIDNETSKRKLGRGKKITTEEFVNGRMRSDETRMDNGTGLSDRGVKNGIAEALRHGFIVCEIDRRDKARVKKYYSIRIYSYKKKD